MPLYKLNLPDKSKYAELVLTETFDLEKSNLHKFILEFNELKNVFDSCRILCTSLEQVIFLKNFMKDFRVQCEQRNTTFFELNLQNLNNFKLYSDNKKTLEVVKIESKNLTAEIFKNFMLGSFGVNFVKTKDGSVVVKNNAKEALILKRFQDSLKDQKNQHYLININEEWAGCFTLVFLQELGQIQLHSVAGRSTGQNIYTQKDKMNLICTGLVQTLANFKDDYQKMIFSCSKPKVVEIYKNFGFRPNSSISCFDLHTECI